MPEIGHMKLVGWYVPEDGVTLNDLHDQWRDADDPLASFWIVRQWQQDDDGDYDWFDLDDVYFNSLSDAKQALEETKHLDPDERLKALQEVSG